MRLGVVCTGVQVFGFFFLSSFFFFLVFDGEEVGPAKVRRDGMKGLRVSACDAVW